MMTETTSLIGAHDHLVATLTDPGAPASAPGCILMSAGVVHRIGPHRINVKLARALAERGIPSVRLDIAAVGDSRAPPVDTAYDRQTVVDLSAAIDHLVAATGVTSVAIVGICSGAVNGLRCALADTRVSGVLMLDGYAYATRRTRRERWLQRMRSLDREEVGRSLRARAARFGESRRGGQPATADATTSATGNPAREELAADFMTLLGRGVSVYQIFTGSILQHYNYESQFHDAFAEWPALTAIRAEYHPEIDHTLTSLQAQAWLIEKVRQWMQALGAQGAGKMVSGNRM